MKVILTSKVLNLGLIGDIVSVKNGFAKNFLIPNKKAIAFTPNSQNIFEAKRAEFEKAGQDDLDNSVKIKNAVAKKDIIVIESASDDGRLYGSVNSATIAARINEIAGSKSSVGRSNIFLGKPIKEIGVYAIKVQLHSDVEFDLRLIVTRSESEVDALLKAAESAKSNKSSEEVVEKKSKKKNNEDSQEVALEAASEDAVEEKTPAKKAKKKSEK